MAGLKLFAIGALLLPALPPCAGGTDAVKPPVLSSPERAGAADPPDQSSETGSVSADDPAVRAALEMRAAGKMLRDGRPFDESIAAQQRAIAALDELLKRMHQSPPQPPQNGTPPQKSDSSQRPSDEKQQPKSPSETDQTGNAAGTQLNETRSDDASDSSERNDPGKAGDGTPQARERLLQAVWGHLPPAVRQQLLNTAGERMLPQYENAVRKYYEALGERQDADRHRDSGGRD